MRCYTPQIRKAFEKPHVTKVAGFGSSLERFQEEHGRRVEHKRERASVYVSDPVGARAPPVAAPEPPISIWNPPPGRPKSLKIHPKFEKSMFRRPRLAGVDFCIYF